MRQKTAENKSLHIQHGKTKPYARKIVSKQFKKAIRAAGLSDGSHFHSLGHSAVSIMILRGVPIAIVKGVLGQTHV